jgi:hypothetical protein
MASKGGSPCPSHSGLTLTPLHFALRLARRRTRLRLVACWPWQPFMTGRRALRPPESDRKAPGQASRLNDVHRVALAAVLESGPRPAIHGVVRWRLVDLCQWLWEEHRVTVAQQTMSREVRALGYRKLSARPRHHAQVEGTIDLLWDGPPLIPAGVIWPGNQGYKGADP